MSLFLDKPPVTLENHKAVYEHYKRQNPNPNITLFGQFLMSQLMHPHIHVSPETAARTAEHFKAGGQVIIVSNHVKGLDPTVIATLQRKRLELASTRTNTNGIVKPSLVQDVDFSFTKAGVVSLANPFIRWGVEKMRSIPAFREKDYTDEHGVISPENKALLSQATLGLISTGVGKLAMGENLAMFPEGERNKINPEVVQDFSDGVGVIAVKGFKVTKGRLAILPIGMYYGESTFRPHVVEGELMQLEGLKMREVSGELHPIMQGLVNQAINWHDLAQAA